MAGCLTSLGSAVVGRRGGGSWPSCREWLDSTLARRLPSASGRKRQGPTEGRAGTESRSQGVTIVLDRERDAAGNTRSAIFSATGAINDAGAFTVEGVHLGGIGAPTFGVVQTLNRLEGRHGTLMVRETHKVTETGVADVFDIDGTWVVHSGTDDYSRLQGQGKATGEIIETAVGARFHFTLIGTVHFD